MDERSIRILNSMNEEFYRTQAQSFSQTRQHAWPGWERVMHSAGTPESVFDLACGNMRFERFVQDCFPNRRINFYCVDLCEELRVPDVDAAFRRVDIVNALAAGQDTKSLFNSPTCDLVVSFGFMHHVPSAQLRSKLMEILVDQAAASGTIAVSFWAFMREGKLAEKALRTTKEALQSRDVQLDDGDYLVGWNDRANVFRYCHSFTETEIDALVESVEDRAALVDRFDSDGRTSNLNSYVVLKRR